MKPKKSLKILHWLDHGIFPGSTLLIHGFTYDETFALLQKKKAFDWAAGIKFDKEAIDGYNYAAMRRDVENPRTGEKKTCHYIYIKEQFKFTDYEYCKLAHEVLHICQFFLKDCLDRNIEIEGEAYFHTHLMMQVLKVIRKK